MTWNDDPFADVETADRTIIKPNPKGDWGRLAKNREANRKSHSQNTGSEKLVQGSYTPNSSLHYENLFVNPDTFSGAGSSLVNAAAPLLILIHKIRTTATETNVSVFQDQVSQEVRLFEQRSNSLGHDKNIVLTARYLLCTVIDESVLKTPWGGNSHWSTHSLLSKFHNDNFGGEKFFQIASLLLQEPNKNTDILALIYLCIVLGFKGKYGMSERGESILIELKGKVFKAIAKENLDDSRYLSTNWQGVSNNTNTLVKYIPLWVVAAVSGVILLLVYAGYSAVLTATSKPVYEDFEMIIEEPLDESVGNHSSND